MTARPSAPPSPSTSPAGTSKTPGTPATDPPRSPSTGNAPGPATVPATGDDGVPAGLGSESNAFVEAIGPLRLDPALVEVRIMGGTSEFGTRGKAVALRIDPLLLVQSPHVTSLGITNCAIGEQLATGGVLRAMPSGLTDLYFRNTLLRVVPSDLSALQNLRSLRMDQNYLSTLSHELSLTKLTVLDLTENTLTSMDAYFPALESLTLNKNQFDAIPDAVYTMSSLQELQLADNPIAAIVVSTRQYEFLTHVRLKIDVPPVTPPSPELYARGPIDAFQGIWLDLNDNTTTTTSAVVAVAIGTLADLQGFPVWVLTEAEHEAFRRQQRAIATHAVVLGGQPVATYQSIAAAAAREASSRQAANEDVDPTVGNDDQSDSTSQSRDATATTDRRRRTLVVALSVVALFAVLVAVAFVAWYRRRRNAQKLDDSTDSQQWTTPRDGSSGATSHVTTRPSAKLGALGTPVVGMLGVCVRELLTSRRVRVTDVEDVRAIGSSANTVVWLVRYRGSRLLASKRLIQPRASTTRQRMNQFVNEVVIAAGLDHPSIIHLVGVAWTNETDLQALYEYMPNGDLQTHLYENASLPWSTTKLQMAIDIVEALVYTHSFSPPLLHRDLRAKNVLLDEAMKPKLSHFGSARYASEQNTMTTQGLGSGRWLAPEVLRGETDYASASDMYAFGVLLSELDTHAAPYEGACDAQGHVLGETVLLELVASGMLRPFFSSACLPPIRTLASRCLSQDPRGRPAAMQVAYELRLLKREWE